MKPIKIQTIAAILLIIILIAVSSFAQSGSTDVGVSQPIKGHVPPDLSTFPEMFIKDGNFDAIIVVGDKSPASDVIAQSNIIQFFISYTGKTLIGSAKLSSEVDTLEQNIISIGSPCINPVSAEILNQPNPCDKNIDFGKPLVKLFRSNGFYRMVIAGYTDKETRQAVTGIISGNVNVQIESAVEKPDEPPRIIELPKVIVIEEKKAENAAKSEIDKGNPVADELNKKTSGKNIEENNSLDEANQPEEKIAPIKEEIKKDNLFEKIISWFKLFFAK